MRPTSVAIPVAVTTSSPAPRVTAGVHVHHAGPVAQRRGGSLHRRRCPSRQAGSPRSARTRRPPASAARSSLPSAGTMSPAAIETTSPGTSCSAGISASSPSRRTWAVTIIIFWSAATAASALPSWCRPENRVAQRQQDQQDAGSQLPDGEEAEHPGRDQDDLHRVGVLADEREPARLGLPAASSLGPNRAARAAASAELRPRCASTPSALSTCSTPSVCHASPLACGSNARPGRTGQPWPAQVTPFPARARRN